MILFRGTSHIAWLVLESMLRCDGVWWVLRYTYICRSVFRGQYTEWKTCRS